MGNNADLRMYLLSFAYEHWNGKYGFWHIKACQLLDEGVLTGMDGFYKLYIFNDSMVRLLD